MHYDENRHRHPHHREMHHRHDQEMHHPHRYEEEHFQDFKSRWGEPEPLTHLDHQARFPHDRHYPGNQHHQPENRHNSYHNRYEEHQEPVWRQRDVRFDRSNQRAEDRWLENGSPMMPHPRQHNDWERKRYPRNEYWREDEY